MIKIKCPRCQSNSVKKNGKTDTSQRYICKDCDRSFTGNLPGRPKSNDVLIRMPVQYWQTLKAIAKARGIAPDEYLQDILLREFEQ